MLEIKCEHLASVPGPHGTWHHVAFNPTAETVRAVNDWHSSEVSQDGIQVEDRAGTHVREREAFCIKVIYDYGTLVFTTTR